MRLKAERFELPLRKPRVSDTTPNRALLRGFPATYFSDFGLCRRSGFFVTIFGAPSLHPKIPFPAAGDAIVRTKSVYGNARQRYGVKRPRRKRRESVEKQNIS